MVNFDSLQVDIVSAENSLFSGKARFVVLPGEMGEIGVYPRHAPLITCIKPGVVRVEKVDDSADEIIFVSGGFIEVQPYAVTVLSDSAVRGKDLDEQKLYAAKYAAEEAKNSAKDKMSFARAQSEIAIMSAQIEALSRYRKKK